MPAQAARSSLAEFYGSAFLSLLAGNAVTSYGLIVLSDALTGSTGFAASVYLVNMCVTGALTLPAGVLLDRYPRRSLLAAAYTSFGLVSAALAACLALGLVSSERPGGILVVAALNGVPLALAQPGRFTLLGELVPAERAGRATVWLKLLVIVGFAGAPVLIGTLRAHHSWEFVFAVTAALFGLATALLLRVPRRPAPGASSGAWGELAEFLRSSRLVRSVLGFGVIAMLTFGPVQVLVPKLLGSVLGLGEQQRGFLMAALGGGLFAGGILGSVLDGSRRRGGAVVASTFVGVAGLMALSALSASWAIALMLALVGVAGGVVTGLIPAALQAATPDRLRGRIMSLFTIAFQTTPAMAAALAGQAADKVGVSAALGLTGFGVCALALAAVIGWSGVRAWALAKEEPPFPLETAGEPAQGA